MPSSSRLKIVSLAPSVTNILFELGRTECLVGVTRWCKDVVPAEALSGLPLVDDCWSGDPSKLAALEPDLVIGGPPYRAEMVEAILALGLRFVATNPRTLEGICGDIRTLARLVGRKAKGEKLISAMRAPIESVRKQAGSTKVRPLVYCEVWSNPLRTCEPWVVELVKAAGGEFVPQPAGRQVRSEEIIAADPEIIVLAWAATGQRARADLVGKRPGWKNLRAVRKGRIHVVRDELLNTPAPILLDGLKALAAIIHPEIFKGICALAGTMEKS